MSRTRHLLRATRLCVPLAIIGLLAGCSGSTGGVSTSSAAGGVAAPQPASGTGSSARAAADSSTGEKSAGYADPLPSGTRRVRTATSTVQVGDVRVAAARIRTDAAGLGGLVASEQISFGAGPSTMTVRVPDPKLDQAMDSFAAAGAEKSRSMTSDDVTATIADLNSRVATQEESVRRVRLLLDRAQKLGDVVLLEGELTRRESDLEAAQARYRALDDEATLATATITLVTKAVASPVPHEDGFLAGFTSGWTAVKASTTVLLTVLGAVFPFLIVIGVIGVPVLLWRRRRPPTTAPVPAPAPASSS